MEQQPANRVAITDIDMPFTSMVRFMVKWAIAALPALLILMTLGVLFSGILAGIANSLRSRDAAVSTPAKTPAPTIANRPGSPPPSADRSANSLNMAYLKNVDVRNVHVSKDVLDRKGVFGEIKNAGDRALKTVELTIYCLGESGQPIFEKSYGPVREGSFDSDVAAPLKPNYSRQFGVRMDDAPSEWHERVRVEVTNIEFE